MRWRNSATARAAVSRATPCAQRARGWIACCRRTGHTVVGCAGRLQALPAGDADANMGTLQHRHVVPAIADGKCDVSGAADDRHQSRLLAGRHTAAHNGLGGEAESLEAAAQCADARQLAVRGSRRRCGTQARAASHCAAQAHYTRPQPIAGFILGGQRLIGIEHRQCAPLHNHTLSVPRRRGGAQLTVRGCRVGRCGCTGANYRLHHRHRGLDGVHRGSLDTEQAISRLYHVAAECDLSSRAQLVARQHPDTNARATQRVDGFADAVLQAVLDGRCADHMQPLLQCIIHLRQLRIAVPHRRLRRQHASPHAVPLVAGQAPKCKAQRTQTELRKEIDVRPRRGHEHVVITAACEDHIVRTFRHEPHSISIGGRAQHDRHAPPIAGKGANMQQRVALFRGVVDAQHHVVPLPRGQYESEARGGLDQGQLIR